MCRRRNGEKNAERRPVLRSPSGLLRRAKKECRVPFDKLRPSALRPFDVLRAMSDAEWLRLEEAVSNVERQNAERNGTYHET
jgi:hypothetical protein